MIHEWKKNERKLKDHEIKTSF